MEKTASTAGAPYETGVIHGRFQVLHNDHMTYLLAGKAQCRHLVVGITNPDPKLTRDDDADPDRSAPLANPLTYYERYRLIRAALVEKRVPEPQFSIVPFPINFPDRYRHYVPMDAVFFLTIYDDWGRRKCDYFRSLGLQTHVLWEVPPEQKGISATEIRQSMIEGNPGWIERVPESAAALMSEWDIPRRLKALLSEAHPARCG
jgi:nicotinamide-nucleotide adenylyltransferase